MAEKSNSSVSMTTIIHAGVELVILGGLFYWIKTTTGGLQDQITSLTDKVNKYDDLLKRQSEVIAQHENALRQIHSMLQGISQPKPTQKPTPKSNNPRSNIAQTFKGKQNKPAVEAADADLDSLLEEELGELRDNGTSKLDNIVCNDDECVLDYEEDEDDLKKK